jgi:hypothetical protein
LGLTLSRSFTWNNLTAVPEVVGMPNRQSARASREESGSTRKETHRRRGAPVGDYENGYFEFVQSNGKLDESLETHLAELEGRCNDVLVCSKVQKTNCSPGPSGTGTRWLRLIPVLLIAILLTSVALWRKNLIPGMIAPGAGDGLVTFSTFSSTCERIRAKDCGAFGTQIGSW